MTAGLGPGRHKSLLSGCAELSGSVGQESVAEKHSLGIRGMTVDQMSQKYFTSESLIDFFFLQDLKERYYWLFVCQRLIDNMKIYFTVLILTFHKGEEEK